VRRLLVCALALGAATTAGAATPQVSGRATIGGERVTLRYATAFERKASAGAGGYAIVLSERPVRCADLVHLPGASTLRQRWALVSLFATKEGFPTGHVRGELDYPVGDAYVSLSRGVSIFMTDAGAYPGAVWTGRAIQMLRVVEGERYSLNARFAARWCG
jgi:hypothetical protein